MAELIPRRILFGNPERVSPRISPDASTLAWIAPHEGVLNVWTAPGLMRGLMRSGFPKRTCRGISSAMGSCLPCATVS